MSMCNIPYYTRNSRIRKWRKSHVRILLLLSSENRTNIIKHVYLQIDSCLVEFMIFIIQIQYFLKKLAKLLWNTIVKSYFYHDGCTVLAFLIHNNLCLNSTSTKEIFIGKTLTWNNPVCRRTASSVLQHRLNEKRRKMFEI